MFPKAFKAAYRVGKYPVSRRGNWAKMRSEGRRRAGMCVTGGEVHTWALWVIRISSSLVPEPPAGVGKMGFVREINKGLSRSPAFPVTEA